MFQRAFSVSTREPAARLFDSGGTPLRGCLLHGATLERLCDCVLACRVVSRGHVPLYAIVAVHVVATSCPSVMSWPWPSCRGRGVPGCGRGRGVRDSKGRRVAYVAFDGKSGVVAYRDYYQRGSDQTLEESVAAYLSQHEIVEVA